MLSIVLLFLSSVAAYGSHAYLAGTAQIPLARDNWEFGQNELFRPTPEHLLPEKAPFHIDESKHWYQRFVNGSRDGAIRRSSCPAINILANRGYINRSGRNITYSEFAYAVRYAWKLVVLVQSSLGVGRYGILETTTPCLCLHLRSLYTVGRKPLTSIGSM